MTEENISSLKAGWNATTHLPIGEHNIRNRKMRIARFIRNKKYLQETRITECSICHYANPSKPWHFDYHHKNPLEKRFNIRRLTVSCRTLTTIKKELDKCIVVCKLCHADITYEEAQKRKEVLKCKQTN